MDNRKKDRDLKKRLEEKKEGVFWRGINERKLE